MASYETLESGQFSETKGGGATYVTGHVTARRKKAYIVGIETVRLNVAAHMTSKLSYSSNHKII